MSGNLTSLQIEEAKGHPPPMVSKKGRADSKRATQSSPGCRFYFVLAVAVFFVLIILAITIFPVFDRANERDDNDSVETPPTFAPTLTRMPTTPSPTRTPTTAGPTSVFSPTPEPTLAPSIEPTPRRTSSATLSRPVDLYGSLTANGTEIVSSKLGVPVQLSGMSLFWSNTGYDAEQFYSAETIKELVDDWNCSVVRAAMGVEEPGGYVNDPEDNEQRVREVVEAAIEEGIYVIIDFHSHFAELYEEEAIQFFDDMLEDYGSYDNVILEIYNEPIDQDWSTVVKPYAETVIASIRNHPNNQNNLIVVGNPTYSQDVDVASEDPIQDTNLAYVLHFYAGTHGDDLREKAQTALDNGVALFVTEFGTVEADGDGDVATSSTNEWIDWLDDRLISYANWAVNDKDEGASIFFPGTPASGWVNADVTPSGRLIRGILEDTAQENANRLDRFLTSAPTPADPATLEPTSLAPTAFPTTIELASAEPTALLPSDDGGDDVSNSTVDDSGR